MIPRLLHFVWIGSELPSWAARNIAQWRRLNAGWEIRVHDESSLLPCLVEKYSQVSSWCARADLIRYSVLLQHGGWYFDVDFWPFRPLDHADWCWDLANDRVFCSRQQGHKSGERLPYNNAPLACAPGAPGMRRLVDMCQALKSEDRVSYGPSLMSRVIRDAPHEYTISDAGWWFPVSIGQGSEAYSFALNGGSPHAISDRGTAGQAPFAMHLWADVNDLRKAASRKYSTAPAAAVLDYTNPRQYMHSVAAGLEAIGYSVTRVQNVDSLKAMLRKPQIVAGWNGIRDARWWDYAGQIGAVRLACEHGFWERELRFQCDSLGFLHRSSLAERLRRGEQPPDDAAARFANCGCGAVQPMRSRSAGYALILGQVDGDTQLVDSEVPGHAPLLRQLTRHMPHGIDLVYRPHPLMAARQATVSSRWPRISVARNANPDDERRDYCAHKTGTTLADAIAGARFCISINSNALVEATAAGVPCMAFGPSLGIDAGVYRHATLATITAACRDMLDGWAPPQRAVDRYLQWLACYQYTREETASGEALVPILRRAGLTLPAHEEIVA